MEFINEVKLCGIVGSAKQDSNSVRFTLYTQKTFSNGDYPVVELTWHSVVYFSANTGLKRGDAVMVKGSIRTTNVDNRAIVQIYAKEVTKVEQ